MKKLIAATIFVLFLLCTNQALAGGQLSLYTGYLNPGNLNMQTVGTGLSLRGTALYGARVEYDFLKILGIEENFGFSPRVFDSVLFPSAASDVRGFLYSTNLVVNVPLSHFVPYVTGGFGFAKPWGPSFISFDATFAGNYGGGVKLNKLIGPMGLRLDMRGWRLKEVLGQGVNFFEATGAITFTWGH
jgi:hypothetical protein